jgi:hypothetical protein
MNKEHGELIDHLSEPGNGGNVFKCDTNSIKHIRRHRLRISICLYARNENMCIIIIISKFII